MELEVQQEHRQPLQHKLHPLLFLSPQEGTTVEWENLLYQQEKGDEEGQSAEGNQEERETQETKSAQEAQGTSKQIHPLSPRNMFCTQMRRAA